MRGWNGTSKKSAGFLRLNIYLPGTQQPHSRYLQCCTWSLSCVWLFAASVDHSPPGTSVHGILQARILEWVTIPSSRGSSQPRSNPCLPHCRQILYNLRHQGSPWILEWEACAFFRESSWPRVSCIADRCFTSWATREAPSRYLHEKWVCSQKDLYKNIYKHFIQNGPDWKKIITRRG